MSTGPGPVEPAAPRAWRAWRAACPNCGADVEFRSAASAFAVCSYCRSTLIREGEALRRIGQSAELFDDHSPLQIGTAGRYQGLPFTLVGRLQWASAEARWTEWHALFDAADGDARSGWLSEDNAGHVFAFDAPLDEVPPSLDTLQAGAPLRIAGRAWSVASSVQATVHAAQGELPNLPPAGVPWRVVDLRNAQGEVGTLQQPLSASVSTAPPSTASFSWSIGRAVALTDLSLSGLVEGASTKTLGARGLSCPNCGAALEPKLSSTRSIVCGQCKAVVDLSSAAPGLSADLEHYAQDNPGLDGAGPQIPLGSVGSLAFGGAPLSWQVVGYVERCELPDDPEDERYYWREYLLYHRTAGFAFLVDALDGWSWSRPITGVPLEVGGQMQLDGVRYRASERYTGTVTYVLGEFYWRLQRDERTRNVDYVGLGANARKRLNREATADEVVWSAGETLPATQVAQAFRLPPSARAALARDAAPLAASSWSDGGGLGRGVMVFIAIVVIIILLSRCDGDDCDDVRQTFGASSSEYAQCQRNGGSGYHGGMGGAFGGYSSGGSHK